MHFLFGRLSRISNAQVLLWRALPSQYIQFLVWRALSRQMITNFWFGGYLKAMWWRLLTEKCYFHYWFAGGCQTRNIQLLLRRGPSNQKCNVCCKELLKIKPAQLLVWWALSCPKYGVINVARFQNKQTTLTGMARPVEPEMYVYWFLPRRHAFSSECVHTLTQRPLVERFNVKQCVRNHYFCFAQGTAIFFKRRNSLDRAIYVTAL